MNRIRILAAATVATGVLLILPGVASAHHPVIQPSADCADDGWTATFTVTADAVRGLTWSVNSEPFQPDDEAFVFTFDLPLSTMSQSFTANAEWSNDTVNSATASVTRPEGCTIPTTTTTEATTSTTTSIPTSTTGSPTTTQSPTTTSTLPGSTTSLPPSTTTTESPSTTAPATTSSLPVGSSSTTGPPTTSSTLPPSVPSTTQPPESSTSTPPTSPMTSTPSVPPTSTPRPCLSEVPPTAPSGQPGEPSAPPCGRLPATGSPSGWIVAVAALLGVCGAVVLCAAGRHRDDVLR